MTFVKLIDHEVRDELKLIKTIVPNSDKNYKHILRLVDFLIRDVYNTYQYGRNMLDKWITDRSIKRLNNLVKNYDIKIL